MSVAESVAGEEAFDPFKVTLVRSRSSTLTAAAAEQLVSNSCPVPLRTRRRLRSRTRITRWAIRSAMSS